MTDMKISCMFITWHVLCTAAVFCNSTARKSAEGGWKTVSWSLSKGTIWSW